LSQGIEANQQKIWQARVFWIWARISKIAAVKGLTPGYQNMEINLGEMGVLNSAPTLNQAVRPAWFLFPKR